MKHEVLLVSGQREPSGLADMLQQFLEQILAEDSRKVKQAQKISGSMLFRAAEDRSVCVRLSFAKQHIEISDHDNTPNSWPSLTAGFLATAHMTTGEQSPLALVRQRKMHVQCTPWQAPFLLRVLRLMRVPKDAAERSSRLWLWILLLLGAAFVALAAYLLLAN